jgi:hypothetical protein
VIVVLVMLDNFRGPRKTSASPILRDKKVFTTEATRTRRGHFYKLKSLRTPCLCGESCSFLLVALRRASSLNRGYFLPSASGFRTWLGFPAAKERISSTTTA